MGGGGDLRGVMPFSCGKNWVSVWLSILEAIDETVDWLTDDCGVFLLDRPIGEPPECL